MPTYNRDLLKRLLTGELLIETNSWPDDWYCDVVRNREWPGFDPQDASKIPFYSHVEELYHELDDLGWEGCERITGWDYMPDQGPPRLVVFDTLWAPNELGRHYLLQKLAAATDEP